MTSLRTDVVEAVMTVRVVREWSALRAYRSAWNELAARSLTTSVFQTFEWHDAWWQSFGSEAGDLVVALAFADDSLTGVAPLHRFRGRFGRATLGFIGSSNGASDYCDFIVADPALVEPLLDAGVADTRWDVIDLGNVPAATETRVHVARWAAHRGYAVEDVMQYPAPTRILGDVEADRACLNKKSLKRHFNGFARAGTLTFRHAASAQEIETRLDDFFRQHVERWSHAGIESQFADARQREFYRALVPALLDAGWLRFAIVEFDGAPIAYHFGFEYGNRFVWYKPTFEPSLVRKSPGEVLIRFLLEYAIQAGLAEFDFTVGDEDFKYRFANQVRETRRVRVYRRRSTERVDRLERWLRGRAKRLRNRLRGEGKGAKGRPVAPAVSGGAAEGDRAGPPA